jgi:hypothetical protein
MTPWLPWLLTALVTASQQGLPADLEPASLMTTPVLLVNGTRTVSQGTGFFFASTTIDGKPDTVFLVTNYHVVTGRPPLTPGPRAGDRIRFILHENPAELTRVRQIELPLYDQRGDPLWVASEAVPKADVVLVPVPPEAYRDISLLVFTEAHTRGDIRIRPSSGATLLGYPYGSTTSRIFCPSGRLGTWRASRRWTSTICRHFRRRVGVPRHVRIAGARGGQRGLRIRRRRHAVRARVEAGHLSAMPVVREKKPADVNGLAETQTTEINLQLGYVWKAALIADMAKTYRPRR